MKTKMNISRLRLEEPEKVTVGNKSIRPARKMNKVGVKAERRGKMELDIRGCACDDAASPRGLAGRATRRQRCGGS